MIIGLDLMGGDFAPDSALEGVKLVLQNNLDISRMVAFGQLDIIRDKCPDLINEISGNPKVEFVHCPDIVAMSESPTKAMSSKKDSSIAIGFKYLEEGKIDAFIGAGNTGAMMVGALYSVKTIPGVLRPTISSFVPKDNGKPGIVLDVGLNPDCRQDVLMQFGILGSLYMKNIFHVENPRVGLINIGSEKEKGNLLTLAAYNLMEHSKKINFIGNVEGYDLLSAMADVMVCDGFTGNVLLKTLEGFYKMMIRKGIKNQYLDSFNYEQYGGTPILGINKPVIIGHGISSGVAFLNMFKLAKDVIDSRLVEKIAVEFRDFNGL